MDALSIGMERRAQRSKGPMKLLFQEEAKRLRNYERKVFDYFEGHTIISEQDRSFIVHPDRQQIKIVPNGIDLSFFEKIESIPEFDLVFIGNLSYPPNIEAATFLSKILLPKLPGKKLLLAGATPDPELARLTSRTENITLLGWTDDIRSTYKRGKVFIAPMHIGTGMQNKLLEAMALGIPCITTTLANNAIKGVHREHLIVADTEKEMIHAIEELLINMELRNNLAVNAQNFVRSNYSWSSTANDLDKILKRQG
jgi:glycosyltransferase involved in cell wall biosynthesis